jgi:hypothetical protein
VAIVSTDVTLTKENLDDGGMKIGDKIEVMIISRAFDQIQVFDQMLGGYFGTMRNSRITK